MTLKLTSPSFANQDEIPSKFTCDADDLSPELNWSGAPANTKSFVLICDDPDVPEDNRQYAPDLIWDHWVLFNIPPTTTKLEEGVNKLPAGTIVGLNSWGRNDYGGPCPPNPQHHRYFFKLYALNTMLKLDDKANKKQVIEAIKGHIIEKTELVGKYIKNQFKTNNIKIK